MLEYGIIFPRVVPLVRVLVLFCCLQYGTASVCYASFNGLRLTIIDELVQTVSSKRVDAASSLRVTRYIDELDVTMP